MTEDRSDKKSQYIIIQKSNPAKKSMLSDEDKSNIRNSIFISWQKMSSNIRHSMTISSNSSNYRTNTL